MSLKLRSQKLFDLYFNRDKVTSILQRSVNVSPKIGRHLRAFFTDNQYAVYALRLRKVACLKYHVIPRRGNIITSFQPIVACKKKNPRAAQSGSLGNSVQNSWSRSKIGRPIENSGPEFKL